MDTDKRVASFAAAIIAAAALAVYANAFRAPFVFDDISSIVGNPTILQLWPPSEALQPPKDWGFTVSGRPILNYSLAINYAISGLEVWSYHALNLLIHILAGITLFGLVRRTVPRVPSAASLAVPPWALALLVALLWTVHPLQTESVTYIIQRAESLMGLFFLVTLYAFVRAIDSPNPRIWMTVSVAACFLGAGTKEIAAIAPLMALLYDRTFVAGTFAGAWRNRRWRYMALATTWLPLAWLVIGTGGDRGGTMGFGVDVSLFQYWLTQFEAIGRYLLLALWPHPLVFDYGRYLIEPGAGALVWAIPVTLLALGSAVALWRWPVVGFLGAWFFAILAPTSLVPGMLQMIVEHRMYLPLAAVIAFAVIASARYLRPRLLIGCSIAVIIAAGAVTVGRNTVYAKEEKLWLDTLAKRPLNARAHNNLGRVYFLQGRYEEAIARHAESVRLDPTLAQPYFNLGLALLSAGRTAESIEPFRTAVRMLPYYFQAQLNLGNALMKLDRPEEAITHYTAAIEFDPLPSEAHFRRGVALARLQRWSEAAQDYAIAVRLDPKNAEAHSNWGTALLELRDPQGAIQRFESALGLLPKSTQIRFNLAVALTAAGRLPDAVKQYEEIVSLEPTRADAQLNLGIALATQGNLPQALVYLQEAVRLNPSSADAHLNYGVALAQGGRLQDAIAAYEAALRLRPGEAQAHYNLGYALLETKRFGEARVQFEEAVRLKPDFTLASEILQRLREVGPAP